MQPAASDARRVAAVEARLWQLLPADFAGIDLSPVTPLGTCSAVAPVSQNRVVTTVRSTEVVSDSTNALAIEAAARRHGQPRDGQVHLASAHRLVRAQVFGPGAAAHFRLFALVSSARDRGSGRTEADMLTRHLSYWLDVLQDLIPRRQPRSSCPCSATPCWPSGSPTPSGRAWPPGRSPDRQAGPHPRARLLHQPGPAHQRGRGRSRPRRRRAHDLDGPADPRCQGALCRVLHRHRASHHSGRCDRWCNRSAENALDVLTGEVCSPPAVSKLPQSGSCARAELARLPQRGWAWAAWAWAAWGVGGWAGWAVGGWAAWA